MTLETNVTLIDDLIRELSTIIARNMVQLNHVGSDLIPGRLTLPFIRLLIIQVHCQL